MNRVWWQHCFTTTHYLSIFNSISIKKKIYIITSRLFFLSHRNRPQDPCVFFQLQVPAYWNAKCIQTCTAYLFSGKKKNWLHLIYGLRLWLMINWNKNILGHRSDAFACLHSHFWSFCSQWVTHCLPFWPLCSLGHTVNMWQSNVNAIIKSMARRCTIFRCIFFHPEVCGTAKSDLGFERFKISGSRRDSRNFIVTPAHLLQ